MGDTRIHPSTTTAIDIDPTPPPPKHSGDPPNPPTPKPVSPPPIHVVQLPRENILRYPSPENAAKFQSYTRRGKRRRSGCRRCCCFTLCLLLLLAVAAGASAGVLYLVFRFKSPRYAVTSLAIRGMNVTSAPRVSPGFDVSIRAENPNGKVGIYYLSGSSVSVFYRDVKLSGGVLPAFYQPRKNVTVIRTALTGDDVVLGGAVRRALRNAKNRGRVPFVVRAKVPVKFKVGSVKTWQFDVKVKCDVAVDSLNQRARIVSNDCGFRVRFW